MTEHLSITLVMTKNMSIIMEVTQVEEMDFLVSTTIIGSMHLLMKTFYMAHGNF